MKPICLVLVASLLGAQATPEATIRVNVNLIQIDVTVEDRAGKRVPDLTAADFEVFRDGVRQVVKSALWVPGTRVGPVEVGEGPKPVKAMQASEVRRTIALLIDDLSLSFESSYYAKNALKEFVEKNVEAGDLVALFRTSSGLGVLQQFTTDKRQLLAQIDATRLRSMKSVDSLAPIQNNANEDSADPTIAQQAMEQRLRDEVNNRQRQDMVTAGMLSSVQFVVRGLKELPGRKSLILFSESIQMVDSAQALTNPTMTATMMQAPGAMGGTRDRTLATMRRLIDESNRAGVVLYTIDPRGLAFTGLTAADTVSGNPRRMAGQMQQRQVEFNQSQDGMAILAEETGGLFYRNTNDLGRALREALDDQQGYYLLAFQPDDETFEKSKSGPKYHKLSVKVKRGGMKVRYRHGFFGVADEVSAKPVAPIVKAMTSPFQAVELPVKMTPIYLADAAGQPLLRTLVHLDPSGFAFADLPAEAGDANQEPWKQAVVEQLVVLFDQNGLPVDQVAKTHVVKLRGNGYQRAMQSGFAQEIEMKLAKPGAYQIRTAIQDQGSHKTGSAMQFVEIPDLRNKQLAMSDLVATSEGWMERNDVEGGPAMRVIRAGAKLSYAALVYNARLVKAKPAPNLETQVILYRNGKAVYTGKKTPFQPSGFKEGESLSVTGSMQLGANSAPGEYVLQLAVHDLEAPKKQQFAVRSVVFEVRR